MYDKNHQPVQGADEYNPDQYWPPMQFRESYGRDGGYQGVMGGRNEGDDEGW